MQNIKAKDVIELIGIEPANTFFYNALMRDFSNTENRRIEPYEADDCFFTIRELLDILEHAKFSKEYLIANGLKKLSYVNKAFLFDVYMNNPNDFDKELEKVCKDRFKFVYRWKIELINVLKKVKDVDLVIQKFTEAEAEKLY